MQNRFQLLRGLGKDLSNASPSDQFVRPSRDLICDWLLMKCKRPPFTNLAQTVATYGLFSEKMPFRNYVGC